MKETGILFTPENHRAILNKTKWQTRRVMNPQPYFENNGQLWWKWSKYRGCSCVEPSGSVSDEWFDHCPQGRVGDKLYVKEGVIIHADGRTLAGYYMDGARVTNLGEKRLTAMFMAKRFARTWLEITDVRVERVQDISEEDCIAEGCPKEYLLGVSWYKNLWDEINGKTHPWSENSWVWAISFKLVKP